MHGHKITDQQGLHFITCTVVGWVDVFSRRKYKDIIVESLEYCIANKGLVINAYVIMSNHIHLVGYTQDGYKLSDTLRDFKSHTSKAVVKSIREDSGESRQEWMLRLFKYYAKYQKNNSTYQLWRKDNRPIELLSPNWINTRIDYIHNNPVKAGYVNSPEHYIYSSAANYIGQDGLIEVEIINLGFTDGYVHS